MIPSKINTKALAIQLIMFKYYTIAYDSSAEYGFMYLLKEYSSGLLISAYRIVIMIHNVSV